MPRGPCQPDPWAFSRSQTSLDTGSFLSLFHLDVRYLENYILKFQNFILTVCCGWHGADRPHALVALLHTRPSAPLRGVGKWPRENLREAQGLGHQLCDAWNGWAPQASSGEGRWSGRKFICVMGPALEPACQRPLVQQQPKSCQLQEFSGKWCWDLDGGPQP